MALEMRGKDLDIVGQAEQFLDALVLLARTLRPAEIRPADIANEEGVATEEHRRLRAAGRIDDEQADGFRPMARRVDHAEPQLAELDFVAIVQR